AQLPTFRETVALTEWKREGGSWRCVSGPMTGQDENDKTDYGACVLGLGDYVNKNGFKGVVLGLSGGIDSALCAAMAVDALGPDRAPCAMLPYPFTSLISLSDASFIT